MRCCKSRFSRFWETSLASATDTPSHPLSKWPEKLAFFALIKFRTEAEFTDARIIVCVTNPTVHAVALAQRGKSLVSLVSITK